MMQSFFTTARQQSHFLINLLGEQSSPVIAAVAFIILSAGDESHDGMA